MTSKANARKKDLKELKKTAEEQGGVPKKILEALPIGVCLTDKEGKFNFVNTRYTEIYGYEPAELIGQCFTKVVPDAQKEAMIGRHDKFMADKNEVEGIWKVQRKDGKQFRIQANAALVEQNEGEGPFKMTFVVDITDVHTATDHLGATVEMLKRKLEAQELSRHMADHDLRNDLINISQLAELLQGTQLDEKQQRWIKLIHKLSQRTLNTLQMSSDLRRMEQGEYDLNRSEFDLLQVLLVQTEAYAMEKKHRQIDIETQFEGKPVDFSKQELPIEADKLYIERLFANLIGNAIEASSKQDEVQINISTQSGLSVSIHNSGVIPEDIRDSFFDKFVTSGKKSGTGLGTYIAKLITDLHGGQINYNTSAEKGTTITVNLPQNVIQQSSN